MLAATFLPDEYAAIVPPGRPGAEESFQSVFGLTSLDLSRQVMTERQLLKTVLNTLAGLSPMDRRICCTTGTGALTGAADFGLRFAELLQVTDLSRSAFERRIETLSREYDAELFLPRQEVRELLTELTGILECFRYRAGSYVGSVPMFRRLESLVTESVQPVLVQPPAGPVAPRPVPPPVDQADSYDI
jgi:hypothetical protein